MTQLLPGLAAAGAEHAVQNNPTRRSLKTVTMRRSLRELSPELKKVQVIFLVERSLADGVLLKVVMHAKADCPTIGGFEPDASIGAAPHMSAFDPQRLPSRYRATVLPDQARCAGQFRDDRGWAPGDKARQHHPSQAAPPPS